VELLLEVPIGHGQLERIESAADERGKLLDTDSALERVDREAIVDLPDLKLVAQFHWRDVQDSLHGRFSLPAGYTAAFGKWRTRAYRAGTDQRGLANRSRPALIERRVR
jgi:hypothetical protein